MKQAIPLSKIGFGAYRVEGRNPAHYEALKLALESGCNLIDTSGNYGDGDSERLIGRVLNDHSHLKPFIMTKAGYIQGPTLAVAQKLVAEGMPPEAVVQVDETTHYSIHPQFLGYQIRASLQNLGVRHIDCFFLHNPEYLLTAAPGMAPDDFYNTLKTAFVFLETQVNGGHIKHYGISSNLFPLCNGGYKPVDLGRILDIAREVSAEHHFRFIQFPYNLLEAGGTIRYNGTDSLVELAQKNNIVTIANRPLNANSETGAVRLAVYDAGPSADLPPMDEMMEKCITIIREKTAHLDEEYRQAAANISGFLRQSAGSFITTESVYPFFDRMLYPFLLAIYDHEIEQEALWQFSLLRKCLLRSASDNMAERTQGVFAGFVDEGMFDASDTRPIPVQVCEHYLHSGIDHVLVGMRTPAYVEQMKPLF